MNDKGGFSGWLSYRMKVLRVSDRHFFRFVWSVAIIIVAVTVIISAMVTSANEKKAKKKTKKEEPKTEVVATVTDATETDSKKAKETEWNLILVNKDNPLPKGYSVPEFEELNNNQKVDSRIYPELQKLFDDARAQGYSPTITKSYAVPEGSGDLQALLDQGMTKEQAEAKLGESSGDKITDEHATGLAIDVESSASEDDRNNLYKWFETNLADYGFIIRYPDNKVPFTGVDDDKWHLRYVGKEAAKAMQESGQCLEEYLGAE